jgi:[glutamine synthetase] adenylyltransferase / [glutamine synthetase]-adenylyl-L-tyrosine phosphorylase
VSEALPAVLSVLASKSAAPERVSLAFSRLAALLPGRVDSMVDDSGPTQQALAFASVVAASDSLGRLCVTERSALDVLGNLDNEVRVEPSDEHSLALGHRLQILRVAARDLLGIDSFDEVTRALSESASRLLDASVSLAGSAEGELAVIGMGKLGGNELNYASDVDVVFVTAPSSDDELARRVVGIARKSVRVDVDLRPEGRSGPLTRTLEGYEAYWGRWAETWEFQALIKARAVAGAVGLGRLFEQAAGAQVWDRAYSSDEIALIRRLKERSEAMVQRRGLTDRELKRGPGGIRDIEFAVQLLQLVHGRRDATIRSRTTLDALSQLAASGYVGVEQARALEDAYRFLRTVEHRLQLVEEQQTHTLPADGQAKERLARVMGFEDGPGARATALFEEALRARRAEVRSLHEQLFFRPLLEAFAGLPAADSSSGQLMSQDQIADRLEAFGFAGAERTRAAVKELGQGLTRSSRLMGQMLPLLLDWLSVTPDPDLGLLGLRNLLVHPHQRSRLVTVFRESPEAARRLCLLLGSSTTLGEAVARNPELMARLGYDDALAVSTSSQLSSELAARVEPSGASSDLRARLLRFKQEQFVRVASRDLLDLDDATSAETAMSNVAQAVLQAALQIVDPEVPFCVIGLGRFGGGELSYASDLDVLFVYDDPSTREDELSPAEGVAERLLRLIRGPSPAEQIYNLDVGLRPEGGQGRLSRDLHGFSLYFERWAETWERQALLRVRPIAGDPQLARRFMELASEFVFGTPIGQEQISEIRRMKARIERERIPAGEDPQFHLKLGRGSLSDVEWTVQLLQLLHQIPGAGTLDTLGVLERERIVTFSDATALRDAYRFCDRTRNRWHLVGALPGGGAPGDSLPTQAHQLSRLSRSLYTTPTALREDYRRLTRRSRRVMERLFYGIDQSPTNSRA